MGIVSTTTAVELLAAKDGLAKIRNDRGVNYIAHHFKQTYHHYHLLIQLYINLGGRPSVISVGGIE